jgi:hypothetical protein
MITALNMKLNSKYVHISAMHCSQASHIKIVLFLLLWLHGSFSLASASLRIADRSFLACALILHLLTPRSFISVSTSFSHLSLGLPTPRLPSGLALNTIPYHKYRIRSLEYDTNDHCFEYETEFKIRAYVAGKYCSQASHIKIII